MKSLSRLSWGRALLLEERYSYELRLTGRGLSSQSLWSLRNKRMAHSGSAPQREFKASLCNIVRIRLKTESHRRARALLWHVQWPGFGSQHCQKQTNNKNQKESKPNETLGQTWDSPKHHSLPNTNGSNTKVKLSRQLSSEGAVIKMFGCSCLGNLRLQHHRCFHFPLRSKPRDGKKVKVSKNSQK